jgi:hypothetical protein
MNIIPTIILKVAATMALATAFPLIIDGFYLKGNKSYYLAIPLCSVIALGIWWGF